VKTCRRLHQYDGTRCLDCKAVWRKANLKRINARSTEWRMANPERMKVYAGTSKRVYDASRYKADPEHAKERANEWRKRNPAARSDIIHRRRARKLGNDGNEPITEAHLKLLLDAQDGCCRYCRTPLGKDKHLDHRIPLARGGSHAPSNVCWACPTCNLRKNRKTESEFLVVNP
jgi:hypothetical protein